MDAAQISRIVEIKERFKGGKERELEAAIALVTLITNNIITIETETNQTYDSLSLSAIEGSDFAVIKDYLTYLDQKRIQLLHDREDAEKQVEHVRLALLEMAKEIKVLEKLKSKAMDLARKDENRRDQKAMDGMALRTVEEKTS